MNKFRNFKKLNIEKSFYALGTLNTIKIFYCIDESLLDLAVQRVLEVDDLMSAFKPDSDVSRLNRHAGKGFIEVSPETFKLFKRSIEFSEMSFGAFDITVRPLIELWGIGKKENYIPLQKEITAASKLIGFRKLILNEENYSAALEDKGQSIDLGGIAKGYAADEIKRIFLENNVKSALINLGGNIVTIGTRPDGKPWRIGVQNPLAPTGQHLGVINIAEKTIVTSGSNERFFIKDGVRYHHILDPRTGQPAQSGLLSITAVCSSSADADALTTSVFILGPERGMEMIRKLNSEVIFVTEDLNIIASNGLKDNFTVFNNNNI